MGYYTENGVLYGVASQAEGRRRAWTAPNGAIIILPILLVGGERDPATNEDVWRAEFVVDLVDGRPQTVSLNLSAPEGLDEEVTHQRFRWSGARELVTFWMPEVIDDGGDPFAIPLPTEFWKRGEARFQLTREFLTEVAEQYESLGRGYAGVLAARYGTTPRTIRSWVEKARAIGVLGTALGPGRIGSVEAAVPPALASGGGSD